VRNSLYLFKIFPYDVFGMKLQSSAI
jgi:hypothetical protein